VLNTDAVELGGSGHGNLGGVEAVPVPWHGRAWSINLTLPPLGAIFLRPKQPKRIEEAIAATNGP
jgi:1,4-alpha-glucan branching enzyme